MQDLPTPTINKGLMPMFKGRRVRLVVEIMQPRDADGYTEARASDGGHVTIYTV